MSNVINFNHTLIAHRGASGYAPENTLIALRKAHELGATWVEFDVMLSRDHVPIIIHDETLERTTNAAGYVADKDYSDLIALDAGSWFAAEYAGEPVPTFKEYLDYLQSVNMAINVEIKPSFGKERETATEVIETLDRYWPAHLPLLVSSSEMFCLQQVRQLNPSVKLGWIVDTWSVEVERVIHDFPLFSVHANHEIINRQRVQMLNARNLLVLAYTVNNLDRAQALFRDGVCAVFTDYPDLLRRAIRQPLMNMPK